MSFATPDMMRGTHSTGSQQALNMASNALFGAAYDNSMHARMALQASINNNKQILGANTFGAMHPGMVSMLDGTYTHMPTQAMPLSASSIQISTTPAPQSSDSQSMPLAEKQNTLDKPTFADARQLADKMFAKKRTGSEIDQDVHEALLDHKDHITRVSTQHKALETGLLQHTALMQKLHAQAQGLQKQVDAAKGGLDTHAQILDTMHGGMMNHTGALNSLNTKVKLSDYKILETESRLSATLAQIQESLEEVEHAVVTHANILDDHETRLKQESTTNAQYTAVPDVMSMAPRRR